ncbi:MAG: ATP-binding protein [Actinomycetes bacterium]
MTDGAAPSRASGAAPTRASGAAALARLRSTSMPLQQVSQQMRASDLPLEAQLLEVFFDQVPMGIAVFGTDMRLQRCNKTWTGFYEHYFGAGPEYTAPGKHIFELIPGNEASVQPLFDQALAGLVVRQAAHHIGIPGLDTYWDVTFAPLFAGGEVVAVVDIVTDATDRVLALERLEARISAFTDIAAAMTVDQPLRDILDRLAAVVSSATDALACSVVVFDDPEQGVVRLFASHGLGEGYGEAMRQAWEQGVVSPVRQATYEQQVSVVRGFRTSGLANPGYAPLHPYWLNAGWEDIVVFPLDTKQRNVGTLNIYLPAGTELPEDDIDFLDAASDLAAVIVENARLLREAETHAGLVERQRLARDLHDSVSQALFSMTLHARAAERHLQAVGLTDSAVAGEVATLRDLTAGALAEMRALIFELRAGALTEEGLVAAVRKQAAAMTARTGVPVEVTAMAERLPLAPEIEEHLYRLILEALNNALKHAAASRVTVDLAVTDAPNVLRARVVDDGRGFDPSAPRPGHLGLHTMRERAAAVGGQLDVASQPGLGTVVTLTVPMLPLGEAAAESASGGIAG